MKNIFENAYFGKVYKTKDGRKAIYICKRTDGSIWKLDRPYAFIVEGFGRIVHYDANGYFDISSETKHDIVSEWKEKIDEDELRELSVTEAIDYAIPNSWDRNFLFCRRF